MTADLKDFESKMQKSIASLESELATIRVGRANAAVLDRVTVDYYGSPTPVNQVAEIKVPEPRSLLITPWDPSTLKMIEKAILASDVGITPQNDGKSIRLSFPQLTEERRRETAKQASQAGESAKIALRNIRRDALELIKKQKKDGVLTEDDQKQSEKAAQDITDKYTKIVDMTVQKKDKEIMEL